MNNIFETANKLFNLAKSQHYESHEYEAAQENYGKAIENAEQLPADNFDYQMILAELYENMAHLMNKCLNEQHKAHEYYEKALNIMNEWYDKRDDLANNLEYMDKLAEANFNNSELMFVNDYDIDYYGEETYYGFRDATCIWERMLKDKPDITEKLLKCYFLSSDFYIYCGFNMKRIVINYKNAVKISESLAQNDPKFQDFLAYGYCKFSEFYQEIDENYEKAKRYFNKSIKIRELMPKDNADFLNSLSSVYYKLADLEEEHLCNDKSAVMHYTLAVKYWEQMPENNLNYQSDFAEAYYSL
ncbi:MAG: hypothetical protein J6W76_06365, partial [Spirochaetales bacterium]|nr:hypothetical protein [Spirochaetales bacterium]